MIEYTSERECFLLLQKDKNLKIMRAILNISPKIYYNYRNKEDLDYYGYYK